MVISLIRLDDKDGFASETGITAIPSPFSAKASKEALDVDSNVGLTRRPSIDKTLSNDRRVPLLESRRSHE